jgi:1-acyl-sn-glycerol-3-phosphate acyltransferase
MVKLHVQQMTQRLDTGGSLILFPEGTSGNGSRVMPFKSSLFSLLEGASKDIPVQPITILIGGENGEPISKESRERYAWFDDTPFLEHMLRALLSPKTNVEVIFHKPVEPTGFTSRKDLAGYTHQVISKPLYS